MIFANVVQYGSVHGDDGNIQANVFHQLHKSCWCAHCRQSKFHAFVKHAIQFNLAVVVHVVCNCEQSSVNTRNKQDILMFVLWQ